MEAVAQVIIVTGFLTTVLAVATVAQIADNDYDRKLFSYLGKLFKALVKLLTNFKSKVVLAPTTKSLEAAIKGQEKRVNISYKAMVAAREHKSFKAYAIHKQEYQIRCDTLYTLKIRAYSAR